jgi:hypothetical protein
MRKIPVILSIFILSLQACNKEDAATAGFDFSNTLPPYVELASTAAKTVKQGSSTTVTFQMRTAFQQAVTVYYDVTGGGVNLTNQSVVIERNKLNAATTINIPAGVITAPNTSATATLTLVKAVTAGGTQLTIGQKNSPATQKVTLNITP